MKRKVIITSIALSLAFIMVSAFKPNNVANKYATIRIYEGQSKIVMVYDGKTEELKINKPSPDNIVSNTAKINEVINLMASKGYELISQSGGDSNHMYTFIKK